MIRTEATTETMESKGGLILAGKVAGKAGPGAIRSPATKRAGAVITSLFGLLAEGRSGFEGMGEKRGSLFFREAMALPFVYAKETVRLYLGRMAGDADAVIGQLRESSARIIRQGPLHGLWVNGRHYLPVDIDTSAMDNSKTEKEGVSRTYRGFDGYHPIMAYVGKEGYMLDCELRPGSQHCQRGTVPFIQGLLPLLGGIQKGGRFLFRMDSGNDSFDTLKVVAGAGKGHYCIIKWNRRRENGTGRGLPQGMGKKSGLGRPRYTPGRTAKPSKTSYACSRLPNGRPTAGGTGF